MSVYVYILLLIYGAWFLKIILRIFKFVRDVVNTNDYKEIIIKNARTDFIVFIGLFLFMWFIEEILDLLTIYFTTLIMVVIFFIVVFKIFQTLVISGLGIIRLFKHSKIYTPSCFIQVVAPVVALILYCVIIINFDFTITKIKLEHFLYQEKREEKINYRLENEKGYTDILWRTFEEDEILAGYWIYKGILAGFGILYYTSVDSQDVIKKYCSRVEYEIVEINKIDDNWYYVRFE